MTPAAMERLRLQAKAEMERRRRGGDWSGSVLAHEEYQTRPLEWINEFLGVPLETLVWSLSPEYAKHQWDGHTDPLRRVLETLAAGRDCGVEAATGVGKTFLAACIVLWFLACHDNAIVPTVAPKEDQLLRGVWKEIGDLWPRFQRHFPTAELLTGLIRMRPAESGREKWAAFAFVCGVGASEEAATKAQGIHAEHMLILTEETPGIHQAIMNALYNTRTDDHNIQLSFGNPDHRHDTLHTFCEHDEVTHIRISAFDHPNIVTKRRVVPGAIGRKRLRERINKLGVGSRFYQSRVRGISPTESSDALIKHEWCVAAAARYNDPAFRRGGQALGVDVARSPNGDKAAIARWQGACLTEIESFPCEDPSELGLRVVTEAKLAGIQGKHVGVDNVGVGAGTVDRAKEEGFKVRGIGGGQKALPGVDIDLMWSETEIDAEGIERARGPVVIEEERFDNKRSQVWWRLREDLRLGRIALPDRSELFRDLTTPEYKTLGGIIRVESKESMVKRLGRSPDEGDATAYGNFVRPRVPLRRKPDPGELKSTERRDRGLERMLAERAKRDAAERKRVQRLLRNMGRKR